VNWSKAEKKLADFYRQHPTLWPLKFLQAGVCLGAELIRVRLLRDGVQFAFSLPQHPPSLTGLQGPGEYFNHVRIGIRAAFARDPGLYLIRSEWAPSDSEGEEFQFSSTDSHERTSLRPEKKRALRRDLQCPEQRHILSFRLYRRAESWLGTIGYRVRTYADFVRTMTERLLCCPVPVVMDGWNFGQGSGKPYDAVSAEYVVGPLTEDVIVRETEPGNGSTYYEVFGKRSEHLGNGQTRYFTRWVELSHPLFGSHETCVKRPLTVFRATATSPPAEQKGELPADGPVIPLWKKRGLLSYQCVSFVQIYDHYQPSGAPRVEDTPGFSCFCVLMIPKRPSGPGTVSFYRRGVLVCRTETDLVIPGAKALVSCARLKTDFSGLRVAEDETYLELLDFLKMRVRKLAVDTLLQEEKPPWALRHLSRVVASLDCGDE